MVNFRVLVGLFSFLIMLITSVMAPVAYWGDKNPTWAKRLSVIGFVAAVAFAISVFWGF
jgi:hypothetical protein